MKNEQRILEINAALLEALKELKKQIHAHHKMNAKKDYSLMVADAAAGKAIAKAQADLHCEMDRTCKETVTHIDDKGFIYCHTHGVQRKGYRPCRQLAPKELSQLWDGIPLASY